MAGECPAIFHYLSQAKVRTAQHIENGAGPMPDATSGDTSCNGVCHEMKDNAVRAPKCLCPCGVHSHLGLHADPRKVLDLSAFVGFVFLLNVVLGFEPIKKLRFKPAIAASANRKGRETTLDDRERAYRGYALQFLCALEH